jgi:hypothetical protein
MKSPHPQIPKGELMRRFARLSIPLLALFVVGGNAGIAQADNSDDDSVVGVHDNNVSAQLCHNQIPVNILGIQIPVQEIAASLGLPIASEDSPSEGPDDSCNQSSAGGENEGSAGQRSGDGTDSADDGRDDNGTPGAGEGDDDNDDDGLPGPLL